MRITGVVVALVALIAAGLLFMGYQRNKNRIAELEKQVSNQQQQIMSLESNLTQTSEELHAQGVKLESKLEEARERFAVQVAKLGTQIEQVGKEYLALKTDLGSQIEDLNKKELQPLKERVAILETKPSYPLNIAYINAEDAFTVFTDAVKDLRQKALDKQAEIVKLQQDFLASKISKEDYQAKYNQLQVELLQAQLNIDIGTLNKLISAPGFSGTQSDLERLKDEAQPVVEEMNKLVQMVRTGVIDPQEFQSRYTEVKNAFTQLDQLLTQAVTSKIVEAANKVAVKNGYDLVLRAKNVIIYRNTAKLPNITDLVKQEIASYL